MRLRGEREEGREFTVQKNTFIAEKSTGGPSSAAQQTYQIRKSNFSLAYDTEQCKCHRVYG